MKQLFSVVVLTCLLMPNTAQVSSVKNTFDISHKSGAYITDTPLSVIVNSDSPVYCSVGNCKPFEYKSKLVISKNTELSVYDPSTGETSSYSYLLKPAVTSSYNEDTNTVTLISDATLYYTLDGSTPTMKSEKYVEPFTIDESCKVSVLAMKDDWSTAYYSFNYTVNMETTNGSVLTRHYYSQLSDKQKLLYDRLYDAVGSHSTQIDISDLSLTEKELDVTYWAFDYENPQYYWLSNSYTYSHIKGVAQDVLIQYGEPPSSAEEVQAVVDSIIKATSSMKSDFEKVTYIHDYLVKNTTYSKTGPSYIYEADGALVHGTAICEGYAKAFAYLCNSVGIDAICVVGKTGDDHMWNMVKVDNKWYHVDVTGDDTTLDTDEVWHDYLCVSYLDISVDHSFENLLPIPNTPKTRYKEIEFYNESHKAYAALLSKAKATDKNSITIHCHPNIVASTISLIRDKFLTDMNNDGYSISGMTYLYSTRTITVRW